VSKAKDLFYLFFPRSIAVIGASATPGKVGAIVLRNIINSGFLGKVYPVNPNRENINDLKCFKTVLDLPEVVDLALIAIPAASVNEVLSQIGEKGVKNVVIYSAGFKEIGKDGERLEHQLIEIADKYSLNILGPNCLGFVNNNLPLNTTFSQAVGKKGLLRFVSQSGALASGIFDWCDSINLGFSEFITLGNKAIINENDILENFSAAPTGLYLESLSDGAAFLEVAKKISKSQPVFVLKPGKTPAAAKAMQSHTGSIAGEDTVFDLVLQQANVLRCATLEDFFDLAQVFAQNKLPAGPRVAVVSNAGGPAAISADAIIKEGLQLAQFDEATKQKLSEVLPRSASIINPVDVIGDALADRFQTAANVVLENNEVDALIILLTPQLMTQIELTAQMVGALSQKYSKPILCSLIGGLLVSEGEKILNQYQTPIFRFPERAIYALGKMWQFRASQLNYQPPPKNFKKSSLNLNALDNLAANNLVSGLGINTPATKFIANIEEAKSFSSQNQYPVVLKLSQPGLLHKKAAGGVIINIDNEKELETAWQNLTDKDKTSQIQIQKQVNSGIEVIIGVKTDPAFGKVLLFGAGGGLAEIAADKNLSLLPLNFGQAKQLIEKSKIYSLLQDSPHLDELAKIIVNIAKFAVESNQIKEIEINPLIIALDNLWAVDVKVIINS